MAKKKSSKQKASTPKEFSSSPFKDLKGLSAFAEQKPQQKEKNKQDVTGTNQKSLSDDPCSFAAEMDSLGVKPLPEAVLEKPVSDVALDEKPVQGPVPSHEERDELDFLEAVGAMGKTFKDEWPGDEPVNQAVPRRMRQVERGQLKPEAELDLHGLTIAEASAKVRFFLQDVLYQGFQTVLIITGKGLHSSDGPVLRQAVEALLNQQTEQVVEWGIAPRRYGGEGALVVFLRNMSG
jgi:DNA-nicking Smr family endonuclease